MCLINDGNAPVDRTQLLQISYYHFVCRYQRMKLVHVRNSITLMYTIQFNTQSVTLMSISQYNKYNTIQFEVKNVYLTSVTVQSAMGKRQRTAKS